MQIRSFTFNPFATNCLVAWEGSSGVVVDPSCSTPDEIRRLQAFVAAEGITIERILLTHAHIDHIFGCTALCEAWGVGLWIHREDASLLAAAGQQGALFGVAVDDMPEPAGYLADGDVLDVAGSTWEVLHTPGHSPGSVSFFDREHGSVISGDVLFHDSIGRTDLWQGSLATLMRSIFERLIPLGDETTVWCGHGPSTTIGRERRLNPFLVDPV